MASSSSKLFLGLDSSTQGLSARVIDEHLQEQPYSVNINYFEKYGPDYDLNESGVIKHGKRVVQPTELFFCALQDALEELRAQGCPMHSIAALSGGGQQHGSVFWNSRATELLASAPAAESNLGWHLRPALAAHESAIWMDTSPDAECDDLEKAIGMDELADITGSRAYPRFTGPQIARVMRRAPGVYENTSRISLISSALASVLLGKVAPIDLSDGSGMNLLDITAHNWSGTVLKAMEGFSDPVDQGVTSTLADKLGKPVPSHTWLGYVGQPCRELFGFDERCGVVAWSGDNPNAAAGLGLQQPGDIAVSLGTSDTLFHISKSAQGSAVGHVFVSPTDPGVFMSMLCYQNGAITRRQVRDDAIRRAVEAGVTLTSMEADDGAEMLKWAEFNELVMRSPPGNHGAIGIYWNQAEIIPQHAAEGVWRIGGDDTHKDEFEPATEARALLEGRFLAMRVHLERLTGKPYARPHRIIATGGGSANSTILQVMSDVLQAPVCVAPSTEAVALGAAYRAMQGQACHLEERFVPMSEILDRGIGFEHAGPTALKVVARPNKALASVYSGMAERYSKLEQAITTGR